LPLLVSNVNNVSAHLTSGMNTRIYCNCSFNRNEQFPQFGIHKTLFRSILNSEAINCGDGQSSHRKPVASTEICIMQTQACMQSEMSYG